MIKVFMSGMAVLLLGCLVTLAEDNKKDSKSEGLKLAGTYRIVSGEKEGQPEPEERIKGDQVRFTDDTITTTDKNSKQTFVASYKVDTSTKPWTITMKSVAGPDKGEVAKGLIEKDGDTIRLIYALPGGAMPTQFKTKDKQLMFAMQRVSR